VIRFLRGLNTEATAVSGLLTREAIAVILVLSTALAAGLLLTPILPLYLLSKGLSPQVIGVTLSMIMLGSALGEGAWGWVINRIDPKIAILACTLLHGIVITGLLFVETAPLFAVVMLAYGLCRSPILFIGRWYLNMHAADNLKSVAMSILSAMYAFAQIASSLASGYSAEAWGYEGAVLLSVAISVGAGVVFLIGSSRLDLRHKIQPRLSASPAATQFAPIGRDAVPMLVFVLSSGVIICGVIGGVFTNFVPIFASDVVLVGAREIGIVFAVKGVVQTLTLIPLGRLADKVGKWPVVPIGLGCAGLAMISIACSHEYAILVMGTIFAALGMSLVHPTTYALMAQGMPGSLMGSALGVFGGLLDVGTMMGTVIGGVVWRAQGGQVTFIAAGIAALAGVPLCVLGRRGWPRQHVADLPGA
jgi:MFS family permease